MVRVTTVNCGATLFSLLGLYGRLAKGMDDGLVTASIMC